MGECFRTSKEVDIHMFADNDHAESQRSGNEFLIHVNTTLVQWFSKKQSIVETSVFGAELVAMNQGIDALRGLRYKFRSCNHASLIPLVIVSALMGLERCCHKITLVSYSGTM